MNVIDYFLWLFFCEFEIVVVMIMMSVMLFISLNGLWFKIYYDCIILEIFFFGSGLELIELLLILES